MSEFDEQTIIDEKALKILAYRYPIKKRHFNYYSRDAL